MTMPDPPPAIQLDQVSRQYLMGECIIRAVDNVSAAVAPGEFLVLLGSSGSGKSTLLNLIAGLDRPSSGSVIAHGQDLSKMSSLELARYRRQTVGMVFQSFNLLPRMTLEENVELPLRLAEVGRSARAARVSEGLARVGLEKRIGHRPSELSGGEQQRTAVARALVNRPKILLADEPTGNLDSATGEAILTLLREIQKNPGMTIVMVTHERILAERFADRLAVMGDGKLLPMEPRDEAPRPQRSRFPQFARSRFAQFAHNSGRGRWRGLACGHALPRRRPPAACHQPSCQERAL